MNGLLRNTLLGSIGGVTATLGNFISSIILARMLGADGSGAVAFVVWCGLALATFCGLGLPLATTRYLPEMAQSAGRAGVAQFSRFAATPLLVAAGASIAVLLAISLTPGLSARLFPHTPLAMPLVCLALGLIAATQTLGEFTRAFLRGMNDFGTLALLMIATGIAQVASAAIGSYVAGVNGAIAATLVPLALPLVALYRIWPARETGEAEVPRARVRRYARYRWASEILALFVWSRIEVTFLQSFWGSHDVGLFTVGLTLANMATQGPLMLTWALLPHLSRQVAEGDDDAVQATYASVTRILAFILCPIAVGLAAILPSVVVLLYGADFVDAARPATILVLATGLAAVSVVGTNLMWAMDRSDVDFYSGLIGAALSIAGGLTLTRALGNDGAALSRAITQLACVGFSTWFLTSRLRIAIPIGALLRILVSAIVCGVLARLAIVALPGRIGIAPAILAGALGYFVLVRLTSPLDATDWAQIEKLFALLPSPLRRSCEMLTAMLGRPASLASETTT